MTNFLFVVEGIKAEFDLIRSTLLEMGIVSNDDIQIEKSISNDIVNPDKPTAPKFQKIQNSKYNIDIVQAIPQQHHSIYKLIEENFSDGAVDFARLMLGNNVDCDYTAIFVLLDIDAYMKDTKTRENTIKGIKNLANKIYEGMLNKEIPVPIYLLTSSPRIEAVLNSNDTIKVKDLNKFPHGLPNPLTTSDIESGCNIFNAKYEEKNIDDITLENHIHLFNNLGQDKIKILSPYFASIMEIIGSSKENLITNITHTK